MRFSLIFFTLLLSSPAWSDSLVGKWFSVDDETGKVEAVVEVVAVGEEVEGKIIDLIDPVEPDPKCVKCSGENKNQPVIGMTIVWGLKESNGVWEGGYILDPKSGNTYQSKMHVNEHDQLEVRGFVGFATFGRTQLWTRAEL